LIDPRSDGASMTAFAARAFDLIIVAMLFSVLG
jgi:hypothetical protein